MEKRQMLIICSIGKINLDFKSITEIKVDRNFSDVGNKFSIDLVDSPEVALYDLELYMNAGYRDIIFKYGDLGTNKLTTYKGTIWDYTNTFVGNIKKLNITGICDRYISNNYGSSKCLYNIDWNSYFNIREDEKEPYGAIIASNKRLSLTSLSSEILNTEYREIRLTNSKKLKLTGPSGGEIELPIPDSFIAFSANDSKINDVINDEDEIYWGELSEHGTTDTKVVCNYPSLEIAKILYKKDGTVEACEITTNKAEGLYVRVSWYNSVTSAGLNNLYSSTKKNTTGVFYTISPPISNKKETFNDVEFINVYDSKGKLVGFRTDGSTSSTSTSDLFLKAVDKGNTTQLQLFRDAMSKLTKDKNEDNETITDNNHYKYYYDKRNRLRAFMTLNDNGDYDTFYLQANPESNTFGSAGVLKSGEGVDISWIVKQLCKLEGWRYNDKDIVQTELVPNSDTFIMQSQSAIEFIQKNLIPKAITPLGEYTTSDGEKKMLDKRQAGFGIFFDSKGYVHFQPLSQTSLEKLNIPNLGYNFPGTPTISFQVNTKGTAFYNFQPKTITATTITSGIEVKDVEIISDKVEEEIRKTKWHNDTFDSWLGLNYETVQKKLNDNSDKIDMLVDSCVSYVSDIRAFVTGLAQNALITSPTTKLVASGVYNETDVYGNIGEAIKLIEDFTITANMNMWGDYRIKPAGIIEITNMVKGGKYNSNIPQKHPSSGKYMIQKVSETVSASGYIQSLDLLRFTDDLEKLINPYNIDYTVAANEVERESECKSCNDPIIEEEKEPEYSYIIKDGKVIRIK